MEREHPISRSVAFRLLQTQMKRIMQLMQVMTPMEALFICYIELFLPREYDPLPFEKDWVYCPSTHFDRTVFEGETITRMVMQLNSRCFVSVKRIMHRRWIKIERENINLALNLDSVSTYGSI